MAERSVIPKSETRKLKLASSGRHGRDGSRDRLQEYRNGAYVGTALVEVSVDHLWSRNYSIPLGGFPCFAASSHFSMEFTQSLSPVSKPSWVAIQLPLRSRSQFCGMA